METAKDVGMVLATLVWMIWEFLKVRKAIPIFGAILGIIAAIKWGSKILDWITTHRKK